MRSLVLCLLSLATLAEAQMGHDLRPALGIDAPEGYESVAASDGSGCLLYTSPSPRDGLLSRMPSSA